MNTTPEHLELLVMAHRYLYYVECQPVISDYEYDMIEKQAREVLSYTSPVHKVGSSLPSSYTEEQKRFALDMLH